MSNKNRELMNCRKGAKRDMKKKTTKYLSMMLSVAMLLSVGGQVVYAEDKSEYPEYLNVESAYPIIKDEYADDITLTMAIVMQSDAGEWDDLWISKYLSAKYNINLEVEYITYDTLTERKNLMLAANDLPDIMVNCEFTTADLVKYGAEEGMFLQMDDYLNETLTPNILEYMVDDVKASCTATDGHIYTLPCIQDINSGNNNVKGRLFINSAWLEKVGLEIPRTLDEFVEAMYAIKEADPAGVGSENLYPFGGGEDETTNSSWYILNALGYICYGMDMYGLSPALRDGEVVIPCYDMDVFKEYLTLMNQFYTDGIIAPDFFTLDTTRLNAYMNGGQTAMYNNAPYLAGIENWAEYEACYPLTSEWQTEPELAAAKSTVIGGFVISAETEYPELCMRLGNAFFNNTDDYCAGLYGGYGTDTEYAFDYLQKQYWPETHTYSVDTTKTPDNMGNWPYTVQYLNGNTWNIGAMLLPESVEKLVREVHGYEDAEIVDDKLGINSWRESFDENMMPYTVNGFPSNLYAPTETRERLDYLETVIEPYAEEQIALFISGKRDLSEVDAFKEELKNLGMEEVLELYTELYEAYIQ